MTPSGTENARMSRRRRLQERQAVIFGLLIALMVVTALGALAIYSGAVKAPFDQDITRPTLSAEFAGAKTPCLPDKTMPVTYSTITVTVLNASGRSQIAAANMAVLKKRGFNVAGTGNAPESDLTQIRFGTTGIAAAYTLAAQYSNPIMLLDSRPDATVDLVIGKNFTSPIDPELVKLDAKVPLVSSQGCVPLDQITPITWKAPTPAADKAQG